MVGIEPIEDELLSAFSGCGVRRGDLEGSEVIDLLGDIEGAGVLDFEHAEDDVGGSCAA